MKDFDALFSEYIIDGVRMEATPADLIKECMTPQKWEETLAGMAGARDGAEGSVADREAGLQPIVDEPADRDPVHFSYSAGQLAEYAVRVAAVCRLHSAGHGEIVLCHPRSSARLLVAECIIGALWRSGHFRLDNLEIGCSWEWDSGPVGNMAAFYDSLDAAMSYVYDLGVRVGRLDYREMPGCRDAGFDPVAVTPGVMSGEDFAEPSSVPDLYIEDEPQSRAAAVEIGEKAITGKAEPLFGPLVYIPFDTCPHRLGGSVLGDVLGQGNESAPEIMDPDYFIDCFEVVRELVEDGVVNAAETVGRGGLASALDKILDDNTGISLDISGIEKAYLETDPIRILFAEIPGVVIQIRETDFDYVDSQLLLQDVAYYPLGVPTGDFREGSRIRLSGSSRTDIAGILAALMSGQSPEGED